MSADGQPSALVLAIPVAGLDAAHVPVPVLESSGIQRVGDRSIIRGESMSRGIIGTAIKGAFKIYLVPATRARDAIASAIEGWSELVSEARQERQASKLAAERRVPETEATEAPPTLVATGESSVEVRPNPAISPAHATSGVVGHLPPDVRHKLAGDGPIRA